jgi:hypothetical protein
LDAHRGRPIELPDAVQPPGPQDELATVIRKLHARRADDNDNDNDNDRAR